MLKAHYYKTDGAKGGEEKLPDWLFDGVVNEDVLHQVIKIHLLNQRQGTASAKSRGQVRGGSRKPWRQKGTGRARQGTIRAVQWAGGGIAFPPIPHSWRQRVPKKVRALARRSALNFRAQSDRVILVDSLEFDAPKTKKLRAVLSAIGSQGKVLVLTEGSKENVYLSARNLETVIVRPFGEESAYDILWATTLVIEKAALDGAEPSDAHRSAVASRARGEPDVRVRERAAEEERLERRKAKRGHGKKAASKVKKEVKAAPKTKETVAPKAAAGKAAAPKAKDETKAKAASPKAKAAPKVKAAPKAKAPSEATGEATGGVDASSVKLPKVGDLADFLAGFDSAADVETLRARDERKTAQARYEARLLELGDKESDDA
jgi:large subunit ribosomal protein L4